MMHSLEVNWSFLLTLAYPSLCVRLESVAFKCYPKQCNATLYENLATEIALIWTSSRGFQQVCLWIFGGYLILIFFLQHTHLIFQPSSRDNQANVLISNDIITTEDAWMYWVRNVSRPLAVLAASNLLISDGVLKKSFKFLKTCWHLKMSCQMNWLNTVINIYVFK